MASTDARPVPIKNTAFRAVFPILDADGDLVTGAASLDSEVSKDQGTFADCTNEATEIATSSGIYYLDLTSTEMNADCVAVIVKTGTAGAKTTVLVFYPEEAGDINVDVTAFGGTAGTFASGRPEVNMSHIAGSAVSTSSAQIGVNVVNAAGTAWNSGAIGASTLASDTITAAKIATGAIDADAIASDTITAAKIAADAITAAKIADGAIDAATFAADAITAAKLAADVTTELQSGLATASSITSLDSKIGSPAGASVSVDIAAIRNRLSMTVTKTAAVATDGSNSATSFKTTLTESANDHYKDALLKITSGDLAEQIKRITAYNGTSKFVTVSGGFTATPADDVTFEIVNE